jgi:ppGpp synthetase/RelA/SpoT-type nucleotidyltranferase
LEDFEAFKIHAMVSPFRDRYQRDATLADYAIGRLIEDMETLNAEHIAEHGRVAFTAVQGRVKGEDSFLQKLQRSCRELVQARGISQATLDEAYGAVKDLAGVRFSCPYFDEIVPAIDGLIRPRLGAAGYGTDLRGEATYQDKDYLESGDPFGYRSYHFFMRVPTVVDIFGRVEPCLCEVQARTELQHVWADKSHDLLYKPAGGWDMGDNQVIALMKRVSDNLRVVDAYLVDIRQRVRGGGNS